MINASILLKNLNSADQIIKTAAINTYKGLSISNKNEFMEEYRKNGGDMKQLHYILTGVKQTRDIKPQKPNSINRIWNGDSIQIKELSDNLYIHHPSVGIVVGTFAAVPYVHLQLESRKRYLNSIPMLIHDDGSHRTNELSLLCKRYQVDFEHNIIRQPPCIGDMTAFIGGLIWAKEHNLDILLKVSRRWLFKTNWVIDLQKLAINSQYATYSNYTTSFDFGFRTECLAMNVAHWTQPKFMTMMIDPIKNPKDLFVEGFMHNIAKEIEKQNCSVANNYMKQHETHRIKDRIGYAYWDLMGTDRRQKSSEYLWHDANGPEEYAEQAKQWSLQYTTKDFQDPNS